MSVLAWHFANNDRRLGYGDGREIKVGEKLTVAGPLVLCERGLHASERAIDALHYAPGEIICRVRLSGDVLRGDDKLCASERTVIAMADATDVLWNMARWSALQVIHLWDAAGVVRRYLETGDESLRATARAAARTAAWAAASAAASAAAWAAASAAAWAAASDAAWDAARDAAWAAARDAAWAAAWDAQSAELDRRLRGLLKLGNDQ